VTIDDGSVIGGSGPGHLDQFEVGIDDGGFAISTQQPEGLSDCVKNLLAKYFDRDLLDSIRIHTNGLPSYVPEGMGAYASNNDVYYQPGEYDPRSIAGIAAIGHEVTHALQYRQSGNLRFKAKYLADSAIKGALGLVIPGGGTKLASSLSYYGNRFEKEAYAKQKQILNELEQLFKGEDPCP
jgi:hypothetical protein